MTDEFKKSRRTDCSLDRKVQVGKDQEKAQSEKDPHSKNRSVRSHFHGPGASAGVSVEDKYEVGCNQARCEAQKRERTWRPHCKHRWRQASSDREEQREDDQRKEGNEEQQKEEPKTEKINLNQNFCHHSPIEAFGWGGALAIGIQLSQLHIINEKYKKRDITRADSCPLYRVVHALPSVLCTSTPGLKKNVLETDKKRHEDTNVTREDIFEFTLHRIEQELLQELAKKAESETNECCRDRDTFCNKKPEWAKVVYPSEDSKSRLDGKLSETLNPDISVLRNFSTEFFSAQNNETCSNNCGNGTRDCCGCVDQKFNILDLTQQVKRRQSLSDTIHWLPTGFELPQPTYGRNVVRRYNAPSKQEKKSARETTPAPENDKTQSKKSKQTKVQSLEEVFEDFNRICQDYTSTGKGMMGVQEAAKGNMKGAVELWEEASMLGNSKALYNLGLCYETGKGVQKNVAEAMKYYTLAAEANHPEALYNLGLVYMEGSHGFPRDQRHGLELLHQAADQDLPEALRYLGVFYANEEEDWETAAHYFRQAAKHNDMESQYFLALCYEEGLGVEENTCKAAHFYKLAADQGHDDSQYRLAQFHLNGLGGLPENVNSGMELLQAATDQGHSEARVDLGRLKREQRAQSDSQMDTNSITQLTKISTSVSSPTLTDFVRNSFPTPKDLTSSDSLSQLYRDLMTPRHLSDSWGPNSDDQMTDYDDNGSDSGVIFTLGNVEDLDSNNLDMRVNDYDNYSDDGSVDSEDYDYTAGNMFRASLGPRRSYTLPDLHVVSCF